MESIFYIDHARKGCATPCPNLVTESQKYAKSRDFWGTLKHGNRNSEFGIRNRNSEYGYGNRKPETGIHKSKRTISSIGENDFA